MSEKPFVIHPQTMEWVEMAQGERFASQRKRLTLNSAARMLGCSLFRLPPGKAAFPAHVHHANEEAVYILAGTGTLKLDGREEPVGIGDYVALPPGGPAHALVNSGPETLEYLCMSTMISPEVVEYPDSEKVGVMVAGPGSAEPSQRRFFKIYKKNSEVDYYEGE